MELYDSNVHFTYLERCQNAAKCYMEIKNKNDYDEDFLIDVVCDFYQVEKVDMLAETNKQWR